MVIKFGLIELLFYSSFFPQYASDLWLIWYRNKWFRLLRNWDNYWWQERRWESETEKKDANEKWIPPPPFRVWEVMNVGQGRHILFSCNYICVWYDSSNLMLTLPHVTYLSRRTFKFQVGGHAIAPFASWLVSGTSMVPNFSLNKINYVSCYTILYTNIISQ